MKQQKAYGNESISSLKGADRVRLRPAVIFGSDGLEGCEHAVFEILSNAIDEAREGYGKQILVTRFADHSIEVEDFGRGCPVDWNERAGTTGNSSSASSTRAANIRTIPAATTNSPSASTASAPAPRSIRPNTSTPLSAATAINTPSTLKRASSSAK